MPEICVYFAVPKFAAWVVSIAKGYAFLFVFFSVFIFLSNLIAQFFFSPRYALCVALWMGYIKGGGEVGVVARRPTPPVAHGSQHSCRWTGECGCFIKSVHGCYFSFHAMCTCCKSLHSCMAVLSRHALSLSVFFHRGDFQNVALLNEKRRTHVFFWKSSHLLYSLFNMGFLVRLVYKVRNCLVLLHMVTDMP